MNESQPKVDLAAVDLPENPLRRPVPRRLFVKVLLGAPFIETANQLIDGGQKIAAAADVHLPTLEIRAENLKSWTFETAIQQPRQFVHEIVEYLKWANVAPGGTPMSSGEKQFVKFFSKDHQANLINLEKVFKAEDENGISLSAKLVDVYTRQNRVLTSDTYRIDPFIASITGPIQQLVYFASDPALTREHSFHTYFGSWCESWLNNNLAPLRKPALGDQLTTYRNRATDALNVTLPRLQRNIERIWHMFRKKNAVVPEELQGVSTERNGEDWQVFQELWALIQKHFPTIFLGLEHFDVTVGRGHYQSMLRGYQFIDAIYSADALFQARREYDARDKTGAAWRLMDDVVYALQVMLHEPGHHVDPNTDVDFAYARHPHRMLDYVNKYLEMFEFMGDFFDNANHSDVLAMRLDPLAPIGFGVDELSTPEHLTQYNQELDGIAADAEWLRTLWSNQPETKPWLSHLAPPLEGAAAGQWLDWWKIMLGSGGDSIHGEYQGQKVLPVNANFLKDKLTPEDLATLGKLDNDHMEMLKKQAADFLADPNRGVSPWNDYEKGQFFLETKTYYLIHMYTVFKQLVKLQQSGKLTLSPEQQAFCYQTYQKYSGWVTYQEAHCMVGPAGEYMRLAYQPWTMLLSQSYQLENATYIGRYTRRLLQTYLREISEANPDQPVSLTPWEGRDAVFERFHNQVGEVMGQRVRTLWNWRPAPGKGDTNAEALEAISQFTYEALVMLEEKHGWPLVGLSSGHG